MIEPVALITPTPIESPSPTASPTVQPSASPGPTPTASGTPFISVPAISKTKGFVVSFHLFRAGTWIVDVIQSGKSYLAGTASVTAGGSYSQSFTTPTPVVVLVDAYVIVCPNTGGSCERSAPVRVGV